MKVLLISVLFIYIISFLNCSTEPSGNPELKITDGFFEATRSIDQNWGYYINFNYQVIGTPCYISGYTLRVNDSNGGTVIWDRVLELIPGKTYTIKDTINTSVEWITDPVVSIQGSVSDTNVRLNADYELKRRN
jgi:hypothetical protein